MPSKQVTDRVKSANAVLALLDEGTMKTLVAALVQRDLPYLEAGEQMPAYGLMLKLRARDLKSKASTMESADQAHLDELGDDAKLLLARDDSAYALSSLLVRLRVRLSAVFGADKLSELGFQGETPYDPTALSAFGKGIVSVMRKATMPAPIDEELSFNPSKSLDAIEKAQQALEAALQNVAVDKRENQQTQDDKNKAIAAYDQAFSQTANFLVSVFQLAGLADLAKKVRPSTHRPGQTQDSDEELSPASRK